ncbi:MAG: hypothetical protein JNM56_05655, partial [Planctomycetia bacterium]|nr:hypothetical protein [Planctomycetia bacterium]
TFDLWRSLFNQFHDEETAVSVCLAIEQLDEAVVKLANDVSVNVYGELQSLLREQDEYWNRIHQMIAGQAADPESARVAETQHEKQQRLAVLVDLALEAAGALIPWCKLGAAVGALQVQLHNREGDEPLPPLEPLLDSLRSLPETSTAVCPAAATLLDLAARQPSPSPRELLTQALLLPAEAKRLQVYREEADSHVLLQLLLKLDSALQRGLLGVPELPPSDSEALPSSGEKPQWNKERGELRWQRQLARKVVLRAKNIVAVLDAFEAQGWPFKIKDPLAPPPDPHVAPKYQRTSNSLRLHETIKTLNDGLRHIRFHADGTGEGISWQQDTSP